MNIENTHDSFGEGHVTQIESLSIPYLRDPAASPSPVQGHYYYPNPYENMRYHLETPSIVSTDQEILAQSYNNNSNKRQKANRH